MSRTTTKTKTRTNTEWTVDYDTTRRQKLFSNPPKDRTAYPLLAATIEPHIESFNKIFTAGGILEEGIKDIGIKTFLDGDATSTKRNKFHARISQVFIQRPTISPLNKNNVARREVLPRECRETHGTYRGKLTARLEYRINNGEWIIQERELGQIPIMLRSNKCHLDGMTPAQLVNAKEESEELGGYFIVNGNEKLIRMLIAGKRNFPMAIIRPSFVNRGTNYTKYGIQLRSVRPDQSSQTNVLHYLSDGNVTFRFSWRKSEYLVPVVMVLKALVETNDREIFEGLVGAAASKGISQKQFVMDRVELLLRLYKIYGLHGKAKTRAYLGDKFRVVLGLHDDVSGYDAGTEFLRKIVLPHLGNVNVTPSQDFDKFNMILFMTRKLYSLVEGECAMDNPDAVSNQEVLLGGFLYGIIIKEKMEEWLNSIGVAIRDWLRLNRGDTFLGTAFQRDIGSKIFSRMVGGDIGQGMNYFMSTGNLASPTGLDIQQTSGFTVVAEKINFYRFISHFRMVHRGSFFQELRTTTVRKLMPESWGFLCPVHTPDGGPCGLLNHLAHKCRIAIHALDASAIPDLVAQMGAVPNNAALLTDSVVVQLDGRILGYCTPKQAQTIHDSLRHWKVEGTHGVPAELEIGLIPNSNGGQYPGVYMSSQAARFYRPVRYLPLDKEDFVGPFEQPFMSIACTQPEIISGESTHVEILPTNIFSIVANQTPFSDFNQSPRNMYQCQMGKQSMGTPGTAIRHRTDNKTYRLQTGQTPVVRPPLHNAYGLDNFPNGMNSVVAVISYTGYDMDDAMIINKSSHERGFGHGTIYKTKKVSLMEGSGRTLGKTRIKEMFGWSPLVAEKADWKMKVDDDGLPLVGQLLRKGDIYCISHAVQWDVTTSSFKATSTDSILHKYKDDEDAFVEEVRLIGAENGNDPLQMISVKLRIPRAPVIGDKFSSRHGQKGVCSQKWPSIDMPFSESGIQPDTIINPHAFPSRMTIGMFVESLAGKAGALHGLAQDCTPFTFSEQDTAVDYFGHQLKKAGYNYYGNEPMYSGITGEELAADIYIGVVYYQRLRHMVNDKYQVRTTGQTNRLTGQPIKGRKKGGGIRVGEMERDALLAHGTAFLLQDRLFNCSDYSRAWICKGCGSFLSPMPILPGGGKRRGPRGLQMARCRTCARPAEGTEAKSEVWEDGAGRNYVGGTDVTVVATPGVLVYLNSELASMGIKMKFRVKDM